MISDLLFKSIEIELLRIETLNAKRFKQNILNTIFNNEWLRIWIPKQYGGIDISLKEGLKFLQKVASIDGSLGWFVTLTSGANYFSRNILPEISAKIFNDKNVCFGGSGLIGGTAEKIGNKYLINGYWKYATGAPLLTHFTFNAQIVENGKPLFSPKGEPIFLSFFIDRSDVKVIKSWNTIGLVATETHNFYIRKKIVPETNSFKYNHAYGSDVLDLIPFEVFAYLTLAVNYIGMAEHFLESSLKLSKHADQIELADFLKKQINKFYKLVDQIELRLRQNQKLTKSMISRTKYFGKNLIENLSYMIITLYQNLGIKAASRDQEINQVFRDFFTATQHNIFKR